MQARSGSYHRYEDVRNVLAVQPDCPSALSGPDAFITTEDVGAINHEEMLNYRRKCAESNEHKRAERYAGI